MVTRRRLWAHQVTALAYARRERNPALFMEMRLGKCLVAIRRVSMYRPLNQQTGRRVLVVAPSSALHGWESELTAEGKSIAWLMGSRKQRLDTLQSSSAEWWLFNKEGFLALPEIADKAVMDWDAVILDESTFIKNPQAKVSKFYLKNFRDCPHRWILTGTPNPENDLEFWPQLAFLDGTFLRCRSFWDYRLRYYRPDGYYGWNPKPGAIDLIRQAVGQRCLVMRRKDVNMERRRIVETRTMEFSPKIRKLYDNLERNFVLPDGSETMWAMAQYQGLRQICGGVSDGKLLWDGKMQVLRDLLQGELRHESVVVWFTYNDELRLVSQVLTHYRISNACLLGEVPFEQRRDVVQRFMRGDVRVLLVQQAVAQTGMDLSRADVAIYYSEPVSALAADQTRDRILNLQKTGSLLLIYLIVEDSVDADIRTTMVGKRFRSRISLSLALRAAMEGRHNVVR